MSPDSSGTSARAENSSQTRKGEPTPPAACSRRQVAATRGSARASAWTRWLMTRPTDPRRSALSTTAIASLIRTPCSSRRRAKDPGDVVLAVEAVAAGGLVGWRNR